jgi:hypothetical protein
MFILLMLIGSLSVVFGAENRFEDTPFYSVGVNDVDLGKARVTEDNSLKFPAFRKTGRKELTFSLNSEHLAYYNSLSELDRKILLKIISLGLFNGIDINNKKYGEQYSYLYRKNRSFNLETIAILPMTYKDAYPIITDYASYNNWVLKDINVKRDGSKGKYFVDINSLNYIKRNDQALFDTRVTLRVGVKGNYRLDLLISDSTNESPVPYFMLKMKGSSSLTKSLDGTFRFLSLPGSPYVVTYFTGRSEVSWLLYRLLPVSLVRSQVTERITTMLENIQYKAENIKQKSTKNL